MEHLDKNKNGYLSYDEFVQAFNPKMSAELQSDEQKKSSLPCLIPNKEVVQREQ
jgi:hypothetical protein